MATNPPAVFDFAYTVHPDEIDDQQHVHNLRYLQWTLWAAHRHTEACGWNSARELHERKIGWVVRSHDVAYRNPAFAGDQLIVRTWVADVTHVASRRKYVICRPADQSILCRVETRWAFVDLAQRKAIAIPDEVLRLLQPVSQHPSLPWESSKPASH